MRLIVTLYISLAATAAFCDSPSPTTTSESQTLQAAELQMLRATVERQQSDIAALHGRIASLTAQLEGLGISAAATQPAQENRKPKRIVFVLDYFNVVWQGKLNPNDEVLKAVSELDRDQWFNVVSQPQGDPVALQKNMLPAGPKSLEQVRNFLKDRRIADPNAIPAMTIALKWRPDVIWYVGGGAAHADQFLTQIRKLNEISKVRINTTVQFLPPGSQRQHFFWQLAHDSGGVCLDSAGNAMPEPPSTVKPEAVDTPTPVSSPSILQAR